VAFSSDEVQLSVILIFRFLQGTVGQQQFKMERFPSLHEKSNSGKTKKGYILVKLKYLFF